MKKKSFSTAMLGAFILTALSTGLGLYPSMTVSAAELSTTPRANDGEVVITANKIVQERRTVSDTVDVVTADEIAASGATDLYQALKNVGDLNLGQSNKTGHFVRIRGMNSNHTLILVDGKRIAGEDVSETQNVYALDRISLSNVARIEIIKGAASAQYGSDALGGVINIITKDTPTEGQSISVFGSTKNNTINYHASTGQVGKFSGEVNVNFTDKRKVNNGLGSYLFHGNVKSIDLKGKYKVNDYDNLQLDLGYLGERTESNMYDIYLRIPEISLNTMVPDSSKLPPFVANMFPKDPIPAVNGFARKDQVVHYDNNLYNASLTYNGQTDKAVYSIRGYYSQLNKSQDLFNYPTITMNDAKKYNDAVQTWRNTLQGMMAHMGGHGAPGAPGGHGAPAAPGGHGAPAGPGGHGAPGAPGGHGAPAGPGNHGGPGAPGGHGGNPMAAMAKGMARGMEKLNNAPTLHPIRYDFDKLSYKNYGIEFNNAVQANDKHLITYSADIHRSTVEGTRVGSADAYDVTQHGNGETVTRKYGNDALTSTSLYVQDQVQATDKLNVLFGLRYDHNSLFGSHFTPRLGAVYNMDDSHRVKANFATAFKAPTLSEMYIHRLHNEAGMEFYIYGNPHLQPETSTNWDLSYEAEFGKNKNSYGKVTYFHNRVNNLISYKPIDVNPLTFQYVNVNHALVKGVELSAGTRLSPTLSTKLSYTWLDPRDTDTNERLDENAAQSGSLQFLYDDNKAYGWRVDLSAQLMRDYKFNQAPERPGSKASLFTYVSTDLTVDKKFGKSGHAFFGVDNLFNVKRDVIGITGRMWRVGTEWKF